MPDPASVLKTYVCVHVTFFFVTLGVVYNCRLIVENIRQKTFTNQFFSYNLKNISITITVNNKPIQWEVFRPSLPIKIRALPDTIKMFDCLVNDYNAVIRSGNEIHDGPLNLAERKVQLAADLRGVHLTQLIVTYL